MYVLVTYRDEENQMKNEGARMVTTLYSYTGIHLQFRAYGSWDSLFPISVSPTANFQNTIFNDKSAILLHPGTR